MYDPLDQTQLPIVVGEEGLLIGDIVAAQPRRNPAVILDSTPLTPFELDLVNQDVGILNIRSVYDVDGIDTAVPDIETLADPAQTLAADRPARFVRIEKAVPLPDDDFLDFANTAFGRSAQQGMREILGVCAGRAGWLRACQSPRARAVRDQHSRCQRSAYHAAPSELAASAARPGAQV